jgi:hypothetical protein
MLVTCLVVSSLIVYVVPSVTAQVGYKPTVPQFSVTFVDASYDAPPSTFTNVDQYTGKATTTTYPGYHVNRTTLKITIKNQPFTPYTNDWGTETYLRYDVEFKGHFSDNWIWFSDSYFGGYIYPQSDSAYTVLSSVSEYEAGAQLDFRVRAAITFPANSFSEWSKVQTVTVPASSSLQSTTFPYPFTAYDDGNGQLQSPDQTQQIDSVFSNPFFMFGVGVLFASVVIVGVLVVLKQHIKAPTYANNST